MSSVIAELQRQGLLAGLDAIDIAVLLCHVLKKDRSFLFAWPEKELTPSQEIHYLELVERRLNGEPVAYITGVREFWSLPIKTMPNTLIPRPDTEVLVETVLSHFEMPLVNCVDLGTGTGAIALALKSERPRWNIRGVDRIPEAVALARENAENLNLSVEFILGNWCDSIGSKSVDLIVSNPPYIDQHDEHLFQGDVRFEPISALVADDFGLADLILITEQSVRCLKKGGGLFLEHGWRQAEDVQNILKNAGFNKVETMQDYGGNDRVTFGFLIN